MNKRELAKQTFLKIKIRSQILLEIKTMSFDLEKKLALDLYLNLSGTHGFKFEIIVLLSYSFFKTSNFLQDLSN